MALIIFIPPKFIMRLLFFLLNYLLSVQCFELSVCAIFQNEAPHFKEWIEFHKLQGAEHFYLYNNNSSDNYKTVLKPYCAQGIVTLIDWPYSYELGDTKTWKKIQNSCYEHCCKNVANTSKWLAIIDLDEFLFCPDGTKLPNFLKNYQNYGALCVNWKMFGTSGVKQIPKGKLMIECLVRCAPIQEFRHLRGKCIVQPVHVASCTDAHTFTLKHNKYTVDVMHQHVQGGLALKTVSHDKICLNHYWTRTETWFYKNKIRSRHQRRLEETATFLEKRADTYNECTDKAILRFVPDLKRAMGL